MYKKVLAMVCIGVLVLSMSLQSFGRIVDEPSDWAKGEYDLAQEFGIVIQSVTGSCQEAISREDFCELLVNMVQLSLGRVLPRAEANPFTDTTNPAVLKAYEQGLITGMSATTFEPKSKVTREQVAVMMVKATKLVYQLKGIPFPTYATDKVVFADEALFSDWAAESIKIAFVLGIMSGVGQNKFDPKGFVTIEQTVILIFRTYTRFDPKAKAARDNYLEFGNPTNTGATPVPDSEFNNNLIVLQAKFPDEVAKGAPWWDEELPDVKFSIYLASGIYYRPLKVSETFKNPGCPYFDSHTNLNDDDDLQENKNEWALYDQFTGQFNPTEEGNGSVTASDYVNSRGMKLPSVAQLLEVYKLYPSGLFESKLHWPMGIYWTNEIDIANGVGKAINMATGEIVMKPLTFSGFVIGVRDRYQPVDFVIIDGVKYYKPLQPEEVAGYGAAQRKDSRGENWSLMNTDDAHSQMTADAFVHDELNLRLPTKEELLKLYAAFPGNTLFTQLRWPSNFYWTEGSDRMAVSLLNGAIGEDAYYTDPTQTWYVIPVEMVNKADFYDINEITCYRPETVEEVPSHLLPTKSFDSNGKKYPKWENKAQLDQYIAYKKSLGYRLLTGAEMLEIMVLAPGYTFAQLTGYPCDVYPKSIVYWTADTNAAGHREYLDMANEQFGQTQRNTYDLNSIVMFTR